MEDWEESLVRRLKAGDVEAYHQLVEYYGEKLLRLAYIIIGDYQLAEDTLQESYINIYRNIHRFGEKSTLFTWVTRITINNAKQSLRKKRRKTLVAFHDGIKESSETPSITYEIIKKEEIAKIREILVDLPLKYRETLYLYYYEEMKIKEIATILDIGESGVKSRLQRGRNMLGERLRKELD